MFMTNIPRRKIYEVMLVYEDGLIDMQILIFSEMNFNKFHKNFNTSTFPKIKEAYREIKILIHMFLENKKHPLGEKFEIEIKEMLEKEAEVTKGLLADKNIPKILKDAIKTIDQKIVPKKEVKSLEDAQNVYDVLDKFNDEIPRFLETRRDHMK